MIGSDSNESFATNEKTGSCDANVLIVGGGPAGLATALMLAKREWTNITVLEKRAAADYYEPDKSYNYLIDGRGHKLTDLLGLTQQLSEISVPNTEFYLTRINPDGSRKTFKIPLVDPNRKTAYWIPRKEFVLLLYQEIERNWQDKIAVLFSTKCVAINKSATNSTEEQKLEVIAHGKGGSVFKFEPNFLVGCDGVQSIVRNTLKQWDNSQSNRFEMKYLPSASSGLKYKVLLLPPKFSLDSNGKEQAVSKMAYAIRGAFRGRKRALSLGLLPLKNPDAPRSANIITWPDHDIWQLKTSVQAYNFLEKAFPQLPIRQIVSPQEVEQFVKNEGGSFPTPQYCCGLHFLFEQAGKSSDCSAVGAILLGDAVHCFPPDIGQGVNSALEDVYVLHEALAKSHDDLSSAIPLYETLRLPDVKPLVRLAQIAFPWQYNQDPWRRALWNVNFFLRLVLSRLLPLVFSPPAFFLIQNYRLSYKEILGKAQHTTKILYTLGLLLLCGLLVLGFTEH